MTNIELIKQFNRGATRGGSGGRSYGEYNLRIEGNYLVNYNTQIAYRDITGKVYLNKTKYSRTTSKIQSYIRQYTNVVEELFWQDFTHATNRLEWSRVDSIKEV